MFQNLCSLQSGASVENVLLTEPAGNMQIMFRDEEIDTCGSACVNMATWHASAMYLSEFQYYIFLFHS